MNNNAVEEEKQGQGEEGQEGGEIGSVVRGWAVGEVFESDAPGCSHGCVVALPPPDHPVSMFMNTFDDGWHQKNWEVNKMSASLRGMNLLTSVMTFTFGKYPEVWNDDDYRQMAMGILLSMGANMILNGWDDRRQTKWIIAQQYCSLNARKR